MEKKRNNLLLVSAVFGAVCVAVIIISWIVLKEGFAAGGIDFFTAIKNMVKSAGLAAILVTVLVPVAFIFNLIAWIKGNNRKMILSAGIVYFITLIGIPSAIMCFISLKDNRKLPDATDSSGSN